MKSKLTLELNKDVIEKAKEFAKAQNVSLDELVESMLEKLVADQSTSDLSPLVKSLSGAVELPEGYDYKEDYVEYLSEKYT